MKKKLVFSAIPALMLACGLVMAACNGGGGGGGPGIIPAVDTDNTPATYSGSGVTLKVAKTKADLSKSITPVNGGTYYYSMTYSTYSSGGTITISATGTWKFYATTGTIQTGFEAKLSNSGALQFTSDVKATTNGNTIISRDTELTEGSLNWPAAMVGKWEYSGSNELTFETGTSGKFRRLQFNIGGSVTELTADNFTLKSITGNSYTVTFSTPTPNTDCTFTAEAGVDSYGHDILTISNSTSLNLIEDGVYYPTP